MSVLLQKKSAKVRNYKPDQLCLIWNQGSDRMDPMEIDDSLYIKRNLTMEGFVRKGRRSPAAWRNLRNLCVGSSKMVLFLLDVLSGGLN